MAALQMVGIALHLDTLEQRPGVLLDSRECLHCMHTNVFLLVVLEASSFTHKDHSGARKDTQIILLSLLMNVSNFFPFFFFLFKPTSGKLKGAVLPKHQRNI